MHESSIRLISNVMLLEQYSKTIFSYDEDENNESFHPYHIQ